MSHQSPHDKAADAVHEGRPVEAQYVRQGRGGVRITTVLVAGIVLVAIGFAIVWAFFAGPFSRSDTFAPRQADEAAAFQTDTRPVPAADAPTTAEGEPAGFGNNQANVNVPTVPSSTVDQPARP